MISQPSVPLEDLLHTLPAVPKEPGRNPYVCVTDNTLFLNEPTKVKVLG